jgi:hypothetical protein
MKNPAFARLCLFAWIGGGLLHALRNPFLYPLFGRDVVSVAYFHSETGVLLIGDSRPFDPSRK